VFLVTEAIQARTIQNETSLSVVKSSLVTPTSNQS